jgi:IS30 family transposase
MSQEEITRMMNHISSYKWKKLNDRGPYETFSFYHGEEVLQKLGCSPVTAREILLKPALLKK